MNPTFVEVDDLRSRIEEHLSNDLLHANNILLENLRSSSDFVSDLTQHVTRLRGKQIRPILLLLTQRMISGALSESGHKLAAAVEMIHTATLVHDDVIDDADTRRHVATVHRRWNTETSVLLGDYLFSKSFHLAASTGDAEACRLIGLATDRTCEGELNQIAARLNESVNELDYFRIIRDKTGQLFGLSCLLGARLAGGSTNEQRAARRFGIRLGLAFQIADDILDLTQTATQTGKDAANDLYNKRLTLPLLRALALEDHRESAALRSLLLDGSRCARDEITCLEIVHAGIQSARNTANELIFRATRDLNTFPGGDDRDLLHQIASFSIQRQR